MAHVLSRPELHSWRSFGRAMLVLGALQLLPATFVYADECGNGEIEGSEECDDGDTSSGDGCSSTCHFEVPENCTLITEGELLDEVSEDLLFLPTLARATALGYDTTLHLPMRCTAADETVIHVAMLLKNESPNDLDPLVVRHRPDVPVPFTTVIYRYVDEHLGEMIFTNRTLAMDDTNPVAPTIALLDPNGQTIVPPDPLPPLGDPPTCQERFDKSDTCFWKNFGDPSNMPTFKDCIEDLLPVLALRRRNLVLMTVAKRELIPGWSCLESLALYMSSLVDCWPDWPYGKSCRTSNCHGGTCQMWYELVGGSLEFREGCQADSGSLCDAECQVCQPEGCVATPGVVCNGCQLCQSDGHCGDQCGECRPGECPLQGGKCCYYEDGSYGGCCPGSLMCCYTPNVSGSMGCCIFWFQCTSPNVCY